MHTAAGLAYKLAYLKITSDIAAIYRKYKHEYHLGISEFRRTSMEMTSAVKRAADVEHNPITRTRINPLRDF